MIRLTKSSFDVHWRLASEFSHVSSTIIQCTNSASACYEAFAGKSLSVPVSELGSLCQAARILSLC